ncbi:MAG: hypothetical protein M3132_05210 [Actinomycetia bacterium]|nr:hypothetical protein [Actinomycetes bacterium]
MHSTAGKLNHQTSEESLAEVIPLQGLDVPSFYQRNTGALPKIGIRSSELHRRGSLPTPVNSDDDGFLTRLKSFFSNR